MYFNSFELLPMNYATDMHIYIGTYETEYVFTLVVQTFYYYAGFIPSGSDDLLFFC